MLNYLDDEQAAAVELKEPLFFVAVIRGAQKTSTGIRFKKTNENLSVMSNPDQSGFPHDLAVELVVLARRLSDNCGHSVSVSLTDGYLGVCLSRKRSNPKKCAHAADRLVHRAKSGDFDFRVVGDDGSMRHVRHEALSTHCAILEAQVMAALMSGYDVTL